jgi:tetratricopeptide (TPR) repeat protein
MPYVSTQIHRFLAVVLALTVSACTNQQPVAQVPESQPPAPALPPAPEPEIAQVPDRPFEADTLYALLVAEIAGSRNRYDIAVSNYVQQALATRDPGVTARAARIARLLNAHEAALEMADLWLQLEPNAPEAHFIAGAELARKGKLIEAAEHSAVLLGHGDEGFFDAIAGSAIQANDENQITQLQEKYTELLQAYPDNSNLHLGLSLLLHKQGKLEQALQAARRASQLAPNDHQAGLQEAHILQAMGRAEEARESLARLVSQHPDNQRLRLQYARLLASTDLKTAQQQFGKLVEQSPGDPDFTFSLGLIQLERGLLPEAADQFENLTNGSEHSDAAHYYLGQIAQTQGDLESALHHYLQVEPSSEYLPAVMQAADILASLNGLDEALQYLQTEREKAETEDRDDLYLLEAELLNKSGDEAGALTALDAGLAESPESVRLLYARGMLFTQMDLINRAEQDLKRIIELAPDNAAALNALGYTLADRTERLDEAYEYIKAALKLEPEDASILDSMGWVLYRQGKHAEALNYLLKAMEKSPDHEIAAHLGEVLWVSGAQQEAVQVWQTGLQLNPDSPLIHETLERLNADLDLQ